MPTTSQQPPFRHTGESADQTAYRKFFTPNGKLTAFAFACGYVEQWPKKYNVGDDRVVLWREHNCYHIAGFADGKYFRFSEIRLLTARKIFRAAVKKIKSFQ